MLSALSFGAIAAFSSLRFAESSWPHAALALSAFGAAYVLSRLLRGPSRSLRRRPHRGWLGRVGGLRSARHVARDLRHHGSRPPPLTGFGFSLSFPAFGVEAIRRVPPQDRGVALGAYAACFDVSLGLGVPLLGLVVSLRGYAAAFEAACAAALLALLVGIALSSNAKRSSA